MNCPDTVVTNRGSLLEITVVGPKDPSPLQSSMARMAGGWLEGGVHLMSPCHKGHRDGQQFNVPLGDTLDVV